MTIRYQVMTSCVHIGFGKVCFQIPWSYRSLLAVFLRGSLDWYRLTKSWMMQVMGTMVSWYRIWNIRVHMGYQQRMTRRNRTRRAKLMAVVEETTMIRSLWFGRWNLGCSWLWWLRLQVYECSMSLPVLIGLLNCKLWDHVSWHRSMISFQFKNSRFSILIWRISRVASITRIYVRGVVRTLRVLDLSGVDEVPVYAPNDLIHVSLVS